MKGDIDLVQGRRGQKQLPPLGKQCAVGGDDYPKIQLLADGQNFLQLAVEQRLPHEMQVDKPAVGPQLLADKAKSLRGHLSWRSLGFRAKAAIAVADIGNFYIGLRQAQENPLLCSNRFHYRTHAPVCLWRFVAMSVAKFTILSFILRANMLKWKAIWVAFSWFLG